MVQRILLLIVAPILIGVFFNVFYFVALFLVHLTDSTIFHTVLWGVAAATTFPMIVKMYQEQADLENKFNDPNEEV